MPDASTTPYGSILRTEDDTYWYTCGSWRLADVPGGIPSVLAYAPIGPRSPLREGQKTLEVGGVRLAKISNQPLDVYESQYLPSVAEKLCGPRFGRLVFLHERKVVEIRDPRRHTAPFVDGLPREGAAVRELCRRLEIGVEDVGVWGSTLMFSEPTSRHELDLVIYGRHTSRRAYERLWEQSASGHLVLDRALGPCVPFRFADLVVDLFFDAGLAEPHVLHGACIRRVERLRNETMLVRDDTDALFYPAIYDTSSLRLVSFRPAHARRFFRRGCRIRFDQVSLLEIVWADGRQEHAYGVLDYERADRLSS